jgi:hypothetical protein
VSRFTRRTFLKALAVGGATLLVPDIALALPERRYWALDGSMLSPWALPHRWVDSGGDNPWLALFRESGRVTTILAQSQSSGLARHQLVAQVACRAGDVLRPLGGWERFTVPVAGVYVVIGESGPAGRRFVAQWLGAA